MDTATCARSEKREISNQKRLESLRQRQSALSQRQNAVKIALGNTVQDYSLNKRIRFCDDGDDGEEVEYREGSGLDEGERKNPGKNKHVLFESDSEDDKNDVEEERFRIRPQFEGEYGLKLLRLQKKFGDDERFQFDDRFAENDQDETGVETATDVSRLPPVLQNHELRDIESEKTKKKKKFLGIRYDPTNSTHSRFELKSLSYQPSRPKQAEKLRKKEGDDVAKKVEFELEKREIVNPAPKVSKERYYNISENISEAFKRDTKESFSILGLFGKQQAPDDDEMVETTCEILDRKKNPLYNTANPFKYEDSTDEDDNSDEDEEKSKLEAIAPAKNEDVREEENKFPERSRCFFFGGNDLRLKEGSNDFCRTTNFKTIQKTFTENKSLLKRDFAKKRNLAVFLSKPKKRRLGEKHAQRPTA